jgi:two-component system NtrC family sensor kinase
MTIKKLRDWNLRNKIILHVGVIGILTTLFLSYFCSQTQRRIIQATSRKKSELLTHTIQGSISEAMKKGQSEEIQIILDNISHIQDIQSIRILNPEGKILRSTFSREAGMEIDDTSKKNLAAFLEKKETKSGFPSKRQTFLQQYGLILNTQDCHSCHDPQIEINGVLEVSLDYSPVVSILKRNKIRGILISLTALILLTFVILRLFEKLINKPLSRLKKRMRELEDGDLKSQVPVVKADEIGGLAASFNTMITRVEEANIRIEELHAQRMEKAEHLASLGEIAAGLAHEIKNPLAGIKGALEIIYKRTDAADTNKEVFNEMLIQIDRINQIIKDLMLYAKPKELNIRPVSLEECIENAIRLAKLQVKNKKIEFSFQNSDKIPPALVDGDKIQEVLLNLMLNSMAAIETEGNISVGLFTSDAKTLKITVSDNGKGIKEDLVAQIFQPFFTTKSDGTGLGLSICQKTIAAHGGTIDVKSHAGQGTTFTIFLPIHSSSE